MITICSDIDIATLFSHLTGSDMSQVHTEEEENLSAEITCEP